MPTPNLNLDSLRIDRSALPPPRARLGWARVVIIVAVAAALTWWWQHRTPTLHLETAIVRAQTAGPATQQTLLNASGYVVARREATVSSKVTGKVKEVLIEEGMAVPEGQIIAKLDDSNVTTSLRLAEAQREATRLMIAEIEPSLRYAQTEFTRLSSLAANHSVSQTELGKMEAEAKMLLAKTTRSQAELAVAERQVEQWHQQLDDTLIRAPFAGVVTTKNSQPGEMISPMSAGGFTRTGICTLVDMTSLEIEVDVNESYLHRVQAGQPVVATLDAYPDEKFPAKVIAIIPTADRQKATVKVRVGFAKLDVRMLPQMGVKVAFQSAEAPATTTPTRSLVIPAAAVTTVDGHDRAWVLSNGKVERRAITVAARTKDEASVAAGLTAGETVVLHPPADLAEGQRVSAP